MSSRIKARLNDDIPRSRVRTCERLRIRERLRTREHLRIREHLRACERVRTLMCLRPRGWVRTRVCGRVRCVPCAQCARCVRHASSRNLRAIARDVRGQAVIEAAFIIPVLFIGVLLLVQPCILLYDRMVMNDAAAEGCRLLATSGLRGTQTCENFIKRRLGAIPQQENFHVHSSGCSYVITCSGAGGSATRVSITNEVKPLPLIAFGADALGTTNASGNFVVKVEVALTEQPAWTSGSPAGSSSSSWVGAWLS